MNPNVFSLRLAMLFLALLTGLAGCSSHPSPEEARLALATTPAPQGDGQPSEWWLARHQEKLAQRSPETELVLIGDSITHGWEDPGQAVWAAHFSGIRTLNLGFSADRTEHVLWRLEHGEVEGLDPDLVVMMIGTNNTGHRMDPPEVIAAGVRQILEELATRLPDTPVLLLAIFPRGESPDDPMRLNNDETNRLLAELAAEAGVEYADFNAAFLTEGGVLETDVMPDLLHPNETGYGIWARQLEPWFGKFLGWPGVQRSEPFWFGADLSYVNEMEDCGAVYRENGEPRDPFALFAGRGANLVRVRLWNDAEWTGYSDLPDVKKTIRRAREQGMQLLLDFHYSDEWADGEKQIIPKAWAGIETTEELAQALYNFTLSTLMELHGEELLPEMVQVGNETNPELMRGPEDGKDPIDWERNAALLNAGIRAVRDVEAKTGQTIEVMLHIAQPENVLPWFEAAWAAGVRDFDQVGVSYYRRWSSEDFDGLSAVLAETKKRYPETEVIVVETSYPWTLEWADEAPNLLTENTLIEGYPATVEGQSRYLADLTQLVIDAGGSGIVYWEPAWVSTECSTRWGKGSHWENATFFDFNNGNEVLPSIDFMRGAYRFPD